MTAIENYADLIDSIFGSGTATFSLSNDYYNHVIGALNSTTDYWNFKANFRARLERLKRIYSSHQVYNEILVQVNEIASPKNWDGAFAELAAFDHLNQDYLNHKTFLYNPIKPNVTIDKSRTFASELGKSAANLDGLIEDTSLYFDVKCFKDNVAEILEGIYKQLESYFGRNDFHISAEHELDVSYDDYKLKRQDLFNELKTKIIPTEQTRHVASDVIPNLSFRILWGAGIQTAERSYHPYSHAENYHKTIFNYANKFVKDSPSIIVLVVFPWYNLVVSDFVDSNIKMYRALARRVFCQYKHDATLFNTFNSKFGGVESVNDISNNISGIVFLEDGTILNTNPNETNVKSFVYLNPNAKKPLTRSLSRNYLMGLHNSDFDDFIHDNY